MEGAHHPSVESPTRGGGDCEVAGGEPGRQSEGSEDAPLAGGGNPSRREQRAASEEGPIAPGLPGATGVVGLQAAGPLGGRAPTGDSAPVEASHRRLEGLRALPAAERAQRKTQLRNFLRAEEVARALEAEEEMCIEEPVGPAFLKLNSGNVGSVEAHTDEIVNEECDVWALQETKLTALRQIRWRKTARRLGAWDTVFGAPLVEDSQRGGVGLMAAWPAKVHKLPVETMDEILLEDSGRYVAGTIPVWGRKAHHRGGLGAREPE